MSTKRPVAPPPQIEGFTFVRVLGSGGFSDVYLYEQDRPRRQVAVKVLLADLKTSGSRHRFEAEANLMAQLSTHPYIVTIYQAEITDGGHSYLAMEYCSRPSLDVRYRREQFRVDEVLAIGVQVASAVETAHRAGIAHRDIKPANILVTDYNRPALTDFGISGTLGTDQDDDAGMSIPWSPPESFRDQGTDGVLVDVWALGATLYTLLAGHSPFAVPGADNSQRQLINRISNEPLPRLDRADVPESLHLVLATAMSKTAAGRFSSAHALALALQRIQAEMSLSVTPFDVLSEPGVEDPEPDDGAEATRVRSISVIDPERSTGRGTNRSFNPWATGDPWSTPRTGAAQPGAESTWATGTPTSGDQSNTTGTSAGPTPGTSGATGAQSDGPAVAGPAFGQPHGGGQGQGPGTAGTAFHDAQQRDEPTQRRMNPTLSPGAPVRASWPEQTQEERTMLRSELPVATPDQPHGGSGSDGAAPGNRKVMAVIAGILVLLVIGVVTGLLLNNQQLRAAPQSSQTTAPKPADPLDNNEVPDITGLKGVAAKDGSVTFTWTNPQPRGGDFFKWRLLEATQSGDFYTAKGTSARVAAKAGGQTCIQVFLIRADGVQAPGGDSSKACVVTK